MTTRRSTATLVAIAAATLLAGCGDAKDTVDSARDKVSGAAAAADRAAENAKAVAEIVKIDKNLASRPDEVLAAARATCAFIEKNGDRAAQVEEVRQRFDRVGVSSLEAAKARTILGVLKSDVCPRIS